MNTKIFLSILALGLVLISFSQESSMELTFTAENNEQYVPLDSILIENLTQGGDTTLYAPDTVLVLDYVTGIGDNKTINNNKFTVSQNYPNPFKGKTEVNLFIPEKDDIKITVQDILGKELAHYENSLNRGNHTFSFYSGNEKYYLLTVSGKQTSETIKMLNSNSNTTFGEKSKIIYTGNKGDVSDFKSHHAINNFGFSLGDELKYTAYTDVEVTGIIDSPVGNQIYTFQFDGWTPCPGSSAVTDIDGNQYNTVLIGNQCWMKENLKTTTYNNGSAIQNVTGSSAWNNLLTGAYVWYDNDYSWQGPYGALYNWFATVDANGLCPTGWHVPTNDEWIALTDFIGGTSSPHGNELKSCRQVNSPLGGGCNTTQHPRWEAANSDWGTDNYGFSGLPGGLRRFNGAFNYIGLQGNWWGSESSSGTAWHRYVNYNYGYINTASDSKQRGRSVRCLKNF
ncbi:MAG: T9SS type A sorting domain-containing protein [Bacteroidetes bacterium]|nr:T9SS type A sorting domain-containing protein [Bacteroidota bacterium]